VKETAAKFASLCDFIKDQDVFDKLVEVRSKSPAFASLALMILKELDDIKKQIGAKQAASEGRWGYKTERTTKFVYLFEDIKERGTYKIGISVNVRQRAQSVGCKVDIVTVGFGGDDLEFRLHRLFSDKQKWHQGSREWFSLSREEAMLAKKCIEAGRIIEEAENYRANNLQPAFDIE
jgi:hypothetical protein